jgi:hypothetical protein
MYLEQGLLVDGEKLGPKRQEEVDWVLMAPQYSLQFGAWTGDTGSQFFQQSVASLNAE